MENKNIYRKKLAIALKEQGKSYREIGEIFRISRQRAEQLCRHTEPLKITKWSKYAEDWKKLYESGKTIEQIVEEFGSSASTVSRKIREAGGRLARRGRKIN